MPYPVLKQTICYLLLALIIMGCALPAATAQGPQASDDPVNRPIPAGGVSLLAKDFLEKVAITGPAAKNAEISYVAVSGQPFAQALRLDTGGPLRGQQQLTLSWDTVQNVPNDAVLFLRFYARLISTKDESGVGRMVFRLPRKTGGGALVLGQMGRNFGTEWERFDEPMTLRLPAEAGNAQLTLIFRDMDHQVIEIGGIELLMFRPPVTTGDLPHRKITYDGREDDAPWRKEAWERIEKHRKGDLTLRVVDAQGNPIPQAEVQMEMVRHAYGFGTFINNHRYFDNPQYKETVLKYFNMATVNTKWAEWDVFKFGASYPRLVKDLEANGIRIHAHAMMWPAWHRVPQEIADMRAHPEQLRQAIRERVKYVAEIGKGKVVSHDVVNETTDSRDILNLLGREEMVHWFKLARQIDPDAVLYLNENALEGGQKINHVLDEIAFLRSHGAPVGGIGTQAHVNPMSIPVMIRNWQRLADTGLPLMITEYDTMTPDQELQGDFTRDIMIAWFSMPSSVAFIMWGFWDGQHWINNAPMFNRDWSLKPAGRQYIDLVFQQWWTKLEGMTDAQGRFSGRGYLGDYILTITHDGLTKTVPAKLTRDSTTLEVVH